MANDFSNISAENEDRDLVRITSAELTEAERELDAKLDQMGLGPDGNPVNPFMLTAADLAPGGFVHRD